MNNSKQDILNNLIKEPFINQRILAAQTGHSLGIVNRSIKELISEGYLDEEIRPTEKALREAKEKAPKNAIILAAGFGMRMVPINTETPKGLLEIKGERLIECTIRQLHEVGITEIYVVVGFMKEQYEYLIDEFQVNLIVNREYAQYNNLHSLALAKDRISNTYIIPCDVWCEKNPFSKRELYSWYMVTDLVDDESDVRVNRKLELVSVDAEKSGNAMVGIAYILEEEAGELQSQIKEMSKKKAYANVFWESALMKKGKMYVSAKIVPSRSVYEINTYEQLRELDDTSKQLDSDVIHLISEILACEPNELEEIEVLKKGMTNRSFMFKCRGKRFIMRIPGEGTEMLINRKQEYEVYQVIKPLGICDSIRYINPENGYKLTEFIEDARCCDAENPEDVKACMAVLRKFHESGVKVEHTFDVFERLEFYEKLWKGIPSCYRDYKKTKAQVYELKSYIDEQEKQISLCHIDSVPDNFLMTKDRIALIDWEYAGMQDTDVDLAMFIIYSMYEKVQADALIDAYYTEGCKKEKRLKIYCYIAACGLLWSNWCEVKSHEGVEFGEYSLRQYRYAKEYYKYVKEELENGL